MTTNRLPTIAITLLATGLLGAGTALAQPNPDPADDPCYGTAVLAVDGTKGPDTPTSIDPKSPLNAYTDVYRDTPDTVVKHIEYPGGMLAGVNGWNTNLDESVEAGARNLRAEIRQTEARCGRTTQYKLFGFSQGSLVVRKVVEEIAADRVYEDGTDLQDRIEVVYVADPATGLPSRFPGELIPGITLPAPATDIPGVPEEEICAPTDGVCDPQGTIIGYATRHGKFYEQFVPNLPPLPALPTLPTPN
jgi:cutinase